MSTKITSNNQSGGITGQNVTVGGNVQSVSPPAHIPEPPKLWRKLAAWSVGAVGLIASVLGILDYLSINFWG